MLHHIYTNKFSWEANVIGDLSNNLGPCHVAFFYLSCSRICRRVRLCAKGLEMCVI
jgi:hypothetical protein